eukprot:scaffold13170_cov184-Skeletonema_marinoi.AAC.1
MRGVHFFQFVLAFLAGAACVTTFLEFSSIEGAGAKSTETIIIRQKESRNYVEELMYKYKRHTIARWGAGWGMEWG